MKYGLPRKYRQFTGRLTKGRNKECGRFSICACIYFVTVLRLGVIFKQQSRVLTFMKRKMDEHEDARKRLKLTDGSGSKSPKAQATTSNSLPLLELEVEPNDVKGKGKKKEEPKDFSKHHKQGVRHSRRRINKLVPPRPFPTVPTSVSATGPRSNHKEGKNLICITRKTSLACYLRRCKDIIIKDG